MANQDTVTFKALYAPFSNKKRKNWSDGFVCLLRSKNIALLKDSDHVHLVRCKLTGSWCPQSGQTDIALFEGYICEIYEDLNSSARPESAQILPTKKPRGMRNDAPPRAAKLPLARTATREQHADVLRSCPVLPSPHSTAPQTEQRKPNPPSGFSAAPSAAQPLAHQARRTRSDADVLAQFAKVIAQLASSA